MGGLKHRNTVLKALFSDAQSDISRAFGQHCGGDHSAFFVTKGDGIMCWVIDDHICLRNITHHPLACGRALQLFNPPFDVRVTLLLLKFVTYFP